MSLVVMRQLRFIPIAMAILALFDCVAMAQPPSTPRSQETGIEGVISAGPISGGPSRQGVPDSKPVANTEFAVTKENNVVASFKTDDQGRFRIFVTPGHYTVSRKDWNAKIGSYGPFQVDVAAGEMKAVRWECDTGLR